MKILFFSPYFFPYTSGVTTYPFKVLSYLANKNEITVLTFKYDSRLADREIYKKIRIIRMPFFLRISKGFISPQSLLYFYQFSKNADLIILNQPNFEGLLMPMFGKIFHKKIISIFHCQVFLNKSFINDFIGFLLNSSMKIQLKLSDKIIAYTKDYVNSLPYFKKILPKTLFTLPPIEFFLPDKNFLNKLILKKGKNIWIGFAGRISNEKGLEYLIKAISVIPTKVGIQIVFAGPYGKDVAGEDGYYKKIITLLEESKLNYLFLGSLHKNQLFSFYKVINLLVLPSINQTEAFGMVQAEAMLAGTPVISTNLPGVRVPIKLTNMGLTIESKNTDQLKGAITEIINNRKKYADKKIIAKAPEIFDINKVYQFYDNMIYEKN